MEGNSAFADREDAGRLLATAVLGLSLDDPVVVGLPRGGVPVAAEVAFALRCPLDVIVVRKLGVPGHEELGFGAISEDGVRVLNDEVLAVEGLTEHDIARVEAAERETLERRLASIRAVHPDVPLRGRTVVIVDDGIATGIDARAACRVARGRGATRVVLAVPVAPVGWREDLAGEADDFVAMIEASDFMGVGQFYRDFGQVDDSEVLASLAHASTTKAVDGPLEGA